MLIPIPSNRSPRYRASGAVHLLTVACLVLAAVVSLSDLHALAGMILVAAVVMITFVCPFILLILQRSKVRSHSTRFRALNFFDDAITEVWCRLSCKAPGTRRAQATQKVCRRGSFLPSILIPHPSGNFFRENDGAMAGSGGSASGWREVPKPSAAATASSASPSLQPQRHSSMGSRGSSPLCAGVFIATPPGFKH